MRHLLKPPPPTPSTRPPVVDAALAVLIVTSVAYAAAPESLIAPWIKPFPALAAAVVLLTSLPTGKLLAAGFIVAAIGDVLVEFDGTQRLGTAVFGLSVLLIGNELRRMPGRRQPLWWPALIVALTWAGISGVLVLGQLGDRLAGGVFITVVTTAFVASAAKRSWGVGAGALLVATNFTLFAVDAFVTPIPRWLVIGTYDLGLLVLAVTIPRLITDPATAARRG